MKLLALDFETAFGSDYTLSKMSTEAYVRDPRFKAHMVGIKFPDRPAVTFLPSVLSENEELRRTIETSAVLCHHAQFDGLILAHRFGLRPAFWLDSLSMARLTLRGLKSHALGALAKHFGLAEKSVPYHLFKGVRDLPPDIYAQVAAGCAHDVELTADIFRRLLPYVPRDELRIIDLTVRMFTEPVLRLDRPRMQAFHAKIVAEKQSLLLNVGALLGAATVEETEAKLQSSAQFAQGLRAIGYECPMKPSPTGNGDIPAIAKNDDGMKALLEHDDRRVQALAAARLGVRSTIDETRAARLLDMDTRGPLAVYLKYAAAKTIRFGGGDLSNWQNMPRGGEVRKSVKAPEGYKIAVPDASQVECRGLNWIAGEQWVLDAFREGRDIYCETATNAYGRVVTPDDKPGRFGGKTIELGCGFGLGWRKYQRQMKAGMLGGPSVIVSDEQAQRSVNSYRERHPRVVELWKIAGKRLLPALAAGHEAVLGPLEIADGMIYLPNGARLDYEGLRWGHYEPGKPAEGEDMQWWAPARAGWTKYYGGKLVENFVQALFSGLLIREAMLKIAERYRIVSQTHDDILALVPDTEPDVPVSVKHAPGTALGWMLDVMRTPPAWAPDIPLEAEGQVSERYDK